LNTKKFCKALVGATHQVLNHSKQTQNEKNMGPELKWGIELFFQKN
jgi:hypothetical protein